MRNTGYPLRHKVAEAKAEKERKQPVKQATMPKAVRFETEFCKSRALDHPGGEEVRPDGEDVRIGGEEVRQGG